MKVSYTCLTFTLATTFFINISLAEDAQQLKTIIDAKPIKRVSPNYPDNMVRSGIEGWAQFSYIFEKDGSV